MDLPDRRRRKASLETLSVMKTPYLPQCQFLAALLWSIRVSLAYVLQFEVSPRPRLIPVMPDGNLVGFGFFDVGHPDVEGDVGAFVHRRQAYWWIACYTRAAHGVTLVAHQAVLERVTLRVYRPGYCLRPRPRGGGRASTAQPLIARAYNAHERPHR
jgi:hypothetical protein